MNDLIKKGKEPKIFALLQCQEKELQLWGQKIERRTVGILIALMDIVCMLIFILANLFQRRINETTILEFRDSFLETKDFAIEVKNLPSIKDYKNEKALKAMLWQYFEQLVLSQPQQIKQMEKRQKYHGDIADIFFGMKSYGQLELLVKLNQLYKKQNNLLLKAKNSQKDYGSQIEKLQK